jgi:hypothetical protein
VVGTALVVGTAPVAGGTAPAVGDKPLAVGDIVGIALAGDSAPAVGYTGPDIETYWSSYLWHR